MYACEDENEETARFLIERGAGVNATATDGSLWTPLHATTMASREPGLVKLLLENGADPNKGHFSRRNTALPCGEQQRY